MLFVLRTLVSARARTGRAPSSLRWGIAVLVVVLGLLGAGAVRAATDAELDQTTPRRAVSAFLEAATTEDWKRAAQLLDLRLIPYESRATKGPELARQLHRVLSRRVWLELAEISDDPNGRPQDGADVEQIATVSQAGRAVPIVLARRPPPASTWVFSSSTVARIPKLYELEEPSWFEAHAPASLHPKLFNVALWQWLGLVLAVGTAVVIGRLSVWILRKIISPIVKQTQAEWDDELVAAVRPPARLLLALLAFHSLRDGLALDAVPDQVVTRISSMFGIAAVGWLVIRIIHLVAHVIEVRAQEAAEGDELRARGITTQVRVLSRVTDVAVGVVVVALMLTQFEVVRNVGVSLLASAGVAGVVIGFAAQRTFGSLIAGIQLSITQPVRIGDVVVIEKEWGTIEEVTLTYVVVRIWDERRLIVPMGRFLDQPLENWTRSSAQIHGTVFLYVDWTMPVDEMRRELDRIVVGHPAWDGRTKSILVTEAREHTLQVRALVSAKNADDLWNLRVEVRERLVQWLRETEDGKWLPRLRATRTDSGDVDAVTAVAGDVALGSTSSS